MTFEVNHGDCLCPTTGLATLPDLSVDICLTDPPYTEYVHKKQRRGLDEDVTSLSFVALTEEQRDAAAREFARLAKRWVLVFCAVEDASRWREALEKHGLEYIRTGAWIKPDGMPQFTGDRPAAGFESIVIAHQPGKKRWNGGGRHAVWTFPKGEGILASHETQKPLALMESLVRDFSDPGEVVLDPFSGSGSTGVACRKLGRRFIGWELVEKHVAASRKRVGDTREQLRLFEVA